LKLSSKQNKVNFQLERNKIADFKKYSSFSKKSDPLKFADLALLPPCIVK